MKRLLTAGIVIVALLTLAAVSRMAHPVYVAPAPTIQAAQVYRVCHALDIGKLNDLSSVTQLLDRLKLDPGVATALYNTSAFDSNGDMPLPWGLPQLRDLMGSLSMEADRSAKLGQLRRSDECLSLIVDTALLPLDVAPPKELQASVGPITVHQSGQSRLGDTIFTAVASTDGIMNSIDAICASSPTLTSRFAVARDHLRHIKADGRAWEAKLVPIWEDEARFYTSWPAKGQMMLTRQVPVNADELRLAQDQIAYLKRELPLLQTEIDRAFAGSPSVNHNIVARKP